MADKESLLKAERITKLFSAALENEMSPFLAREKILEVLEAIGELTAPANSGHPAPPVFTI